MDEEPVSIQKIAYRQKGRLQHILSRTLSLPADSILHLLFVVKKPKQSSDTFLLCESPEQFFFSEDRIITVQVSLNKGLSFISSNVTISTYKCVSYSYRA